MCYGYSYHNPTPIQSQEERDCWVQALCDGAGLHSEPPPDTPPQPPDAYDYVEIIPARPQKQAWKERDLTHSGEYQGLQTRETPVEPQGPVYDIPQPLRTEYSRFKPRINEPTVDEDNQYEEINPTSKPRSRLGLADTSKPRSRPGSADLSDFTPDQLTLLVDLLQRVAENGQYGVPIPVSPRRRAQPELADIYDDTVVVKAPRKKGNVYAHADSNDFYESIVDDYDEPAAPVKPLPPPKPSTLKKSKQKQGKPSVLGLPYTPSPSTGDTKRNTIREFSIRVDA